MGGLVIGARDDWGKQCFRFPSLSIYRFWVGWKQSKHAPKQFFGALKMGFSAKPDFMHKRGRNTKKMNRKGKLQTSRISSNWRIWQSYSRVPQILNVFCAGYSWIYVTHLGFEPLKFLYSDFFYNTQTVHFTLPTPHSTLYTLQSTLCTPDFTLCSLHSTLYTPHFTLQTLDSTLYTPHFTPHTSHFTLCTLLCQLYTPHFALYTPHSTLHSLHSNFTRKTLHTALYTWYSTLFTHSTIYTPHFTLYTLHSPLYNPLFTLHSHSALHFLHAPRFALHPLPHSTVSTVDWLGNRGKM